jgi:hypothetical protein
MFPKTRYCQKDLVITSASTHPARLDPFGEIQASKLVVAGQFKEGFIVEVENTWESREFRITFDHEGYGKFYPDCRPLMKANLLEKWPRKVFGPLLTSDKNLALSWHIVWVVMILENVTNVNGVYRRI